LRKTQKTPRVSRRELRMQKRLGDAPIESPPAHYRFQPLKLSPKNPRQTAAMQMLRYGKLVTFLVGSAGTGKSIIAVEYSAEQLRERKHMKVCLVRANEGFGKTLGMLPGELEEKLGPWFQQTVTHFKKFLPPGDVDAFLSNKRIEMIAAEHIRGRSFEDCIVIIEEAQNFSHEEFETLLTRLGEGCQLIFTGDEKQNDLKGKSGLRSTVQFIERMLDEEPTYLTEEDLDELDNGIGVVQFLPEDVVRSGLTRALVKAYYYAWAKDDQTKDENWKCTRS